MKWPVGLSTGIAYGLPIGRVLGPIHDARIRLVEVATAPDHLDLRGGEHREELSELGHRMSQLGLEVHSLHAPFGHDVDLTDPDAGFRERSLDLLTRAADALQLLGGGLYVIHPGGEDHHWVWDREARLARSVEGLTRIWERCRERRLTFVVETPLPHLLGGRLDDLAWILDRIPAEGTGVCVDTSHCSLGGFLFEAIERFAGKLVHVQVSDNRGVTDDHLPPGEGILDWGRIVAALERADYRGVFMLEVAGAGDVESNVERVVGRLRALFPETEG